MNKGKFAIASVCMVLSFCMMLQLKSVTKNKANDVTVTARADQLQVALNTEREKNEALYKQIIQYKDELERFRDEAEKSGGYAKIIATQLERASIIAGLTTVKGPGITITMSDSKASNPTGIDENLFIIHDEDLLKVINELLDAGAEAISINGERLIATSEIRCAGSTVSVNNNRYAAPYLIKAIGNKNEMSKALNMRQGVVEILTQWGIKIDIREEQEIVINGYSGATEYKYATAVKQQ